MTRVLTFGVFDYYHYGHLKLLKRAKALGDFLVVAVQNTDEIHKTKPQAKILYSLEQRMEMLAELRCVDEVVPYNQVDEDIKKIDFDILAVGGDQNHEGFQRAFAWCKENGKKCTVLPRTPNICSSQIKNEIK